MSRRERRSVSLGRYRDRGPRDASKGPQGTEESPEVSTRHNISNYLLTLQRLQASEDENQHLRKENDLLRQRARSSRLSSASFRADNSSCQQHTNTTMSSSTTSSNGSGSGGGGGGGGGGSANNSNTVFRDAEDDKIAADVKRNSLLFVGDSLPATSLEHAALEAQYKKLQEDFETVKEFLKHLFQHALSMSSSSTSSSFVDHTLPLKGSNKADRDINSCSPLPSKQLERSLDDIHGQISQLKNSQDQQQIRMEQVQQALDNVLCQSSVRNDVTMRIVRQSDKMKELSRHASFLENQLAAAQLTVRQAEEKSRKASRMGQDVERFVSTNGKILKGNSKDELNKLADRLAKLGKHVPTCSCKMAAINNLMNHVTTSAAGGKSFAESRPSAEVVSAMSKLERLIGSDWHRLGRMLGLPADTLEDVGKFTNFDLTSRVEKVVTSWARLYPRNACAEALRQGLDKMDRDALLLAEQPLCKEWQQLPPEVLAYVIAHMVDTPSLVTELCDQGVVSADNRDFILGLPQEHRRASRLLQSVVYMGTDALALWCTALDQLNQTQVASRVRDCLPSKRSSGSSYPAFLTLDLNNRPSSRLSKTNNVPISRHAPRDSGSKTLTSSSSFHSSSSSSATTFNRLQSSSSSSSSTAAPSHSKPTAAGTAATPGSRAPVEKQQRKKRSRSLFTRKNKLRDTEPDPYSLDGGDDGFSEAGFTSIAPQAHYNYYHPGINVNALSSSRDSAGDRGRSFEEWAGPGTEADGNRDRNTRGGGVANAGGVESHLWVRNPHHQQHHRPHSRHININSGADEVAV